MIRFTIICNSRSPQIKEQLRVMKLSPAYLQFFNSMAHIILDPTKSHEHDRVIFPCYISCDMSKLVKVETKSKWLLFCKWHFQFYHYYYPQWKIWIQIPLKFVSHGPIANKLLLDSGLAPNRRQAIFGTKYCPLYGHTSGLNMLINFFMKPNWYHWILSYF